MSRAIRRIGPLVFWQYVVCLALLPLYFLLALTVEDTWPGWLGSRGIIAALGVAVFVWLRPIARFIDRVALQETEGEPPRKMRVLRVERHFQVFLLICMVSGLLALLQSLSMVEAAGMASGLLAYLLGWHIMLILPLMMWVKDRATERPLPPKRGDMAPGISEFWIVPPDEEDADGPITVVVRTEGIRSLEEVVVAVLGRPALPAITGGKRRWSIVVDGAAVGELTQSWQDPRWWPPIDWSMSPSSLFKGDRVVFRLVDIEEA
jgi:hypothetical protein